MQSQYLRVTPHFSRTYGNDYYKRLIRLIVHHIPEFI